MRNRPWPVIILALIQILMPAFSIVLNALLASTTPFRYLQIFMHIRSLDEILLFFVPFPVAGLAILAMKSWSYPVFLVVMLWTMVSNFWLWFKGGAITDSLAILVAVTLINLLFVTYYLLPAVRQIYFNQRLRWWETAPRFLVSFDGQVRGNKGSVKANIRDISSGGLFFDTPEKGIENGDQVEVSFNVLGNQFSFSGEIVHVRPISGEDCGYGVKLSLDRFERRSLKDLVHGLELIGCDVKKSSDDLLPSFISWWRDLTLGKKKAWLPSREQRDAQ